MVQLPLRHWSVTAKGVRKPDTPFAVYRQIVAPVATPPIELVGQLRHAAVRLKAGDTMLPGLASVKAPLRIEHQAVGGMCPGAELPAFTSTRVISHDAIPRDMGEQQSLAVPGGPLRGATIRPGKQLENPIHMTSSL